MPIALSPYAPGDCAPEVGTALPRPGSRAHRLAAHAAAVTARSIYRAHFKAVEEAGGRGLASREDTAELDAAFDALRCAERHLAEAKAHPPPVAWTVRRAQGAAPKPQKTDHEALKSALAPPKPRGPAAGTHPTWVRRVRFAPVDAPDLTTA